MLRVPAVPRSLSLLPALVVAVLPVVGAPLTMEARHAHAEFVDLYRSIPQR